MAAALSDLIESRVRRALPAGATFKLTRFPSGAVDVAIRWSDGRLTLMETTATGDEFGVTPALEADAGFHDGHPLVFHNLEDALAALDRVLRASN